MRQDADRQKCRDETGNYAGRFTAVLLIAVVANLGFYWLPQTLFGLSLKKVDLLSDIRYSTEEEEGLSDIAVVTDGPIPAENKGDNQYVEGFSPLEGSQKSEGENQVRSAVDAMPLQAETASLVADSTKGVAPVSDILTNTEIEDFSAMHTGLRRFFSALDNIHKLDRPVRIAFLGDSFIEGDIFVADFRAKMQARYGGRGVGFVPVRSSAAQYRPTIKQSSDGWKTYSIIQNRRQKYTLSGLLFEPLGSRASIRFQTVDMYPGLEEVSTLKFIYSKNTDADMVLKYDSITETFSLPPTDVVTQIELEGSFKKGVVRFENAAGLKVLGIALEDNQGVVVDNFSLRGNSGIVMSALNAESCNELQEIRPYDLIVLQYGLNVASDSVKNYGWYKQQMIAVINHLKQCFPNADFMLLGVSDRSRRRNGEYRTMPAIVSLLKAQRQIAISTEIAFWNIFAAMGGQNSMVRYVKHNWASKDYTHLSFRGGRELANAFFDALMNEKVLYDNGNGKGYAER